MVQAWLMCEVTPSTRRSLCRRSPHQPVTMDFLHSIGVQHISVRGIAHRETELARLHREMNCVYRDEILIDGEDEVHVPFFDAHQHPESEIRYVAEGSCYFDLNTPQGDWVRILCEEGDLLVLPPGVKHRFTTTEKIYLHMIRLFSEVPDFISTDGGQPGVIPGSERWLNTMVKAN